eukprot:15361845-Ditylum_brightwellii.AAC.1
MSETLWSGSLAYGGCFTLSVTGNVPAESTCEIKSIFDWKSAVNTEVVTIDQQTIDLTIGGMEYKFPIT